MLAVKLSEGRRAHSVSGHKSANATSKTRVSGVFVAWESGVILAAGGYNATNKKHKAVISSRTTGKTQFGWETLMDERIVVGQSRKKKKFTRLA